MASAPDLGELLTWGTTTARRSYPGTGAARRRPMSNARAWCGRRRRTIVATCDLVCAWGARSAVRRPATDWCCPRVDHQYGGDRARGGGARSTRRLSVIHISEPARLGRI